MENHVMNGYQMVVDIIIPILAALLGGGLTLIGVWLTIRHEKKKEDESLRLSVKPWLFNICPMENYDYQNANDMVLKADDSESAASVFMILKNTDNGIAIIDRIETERTIYYPIYGNLIDKNTICNIKIWLKEGETLKDWVIYIKDVYGKEYKYHLKVVGNIAKLMTN